jgi:hypothetical protein
VLIISALPSNSANSTATALFPLPVEPRINRDFVPHGTLLEDTVDILRDIIVPCGTF